MRLDYVNQAKGDQGHEEDVRPECEKPQERISVFRGITPALPPPSDVIGSHPKLLPMNRSGYLSATHPPDGGYMDCKLVSRI